MVTKLKRDSTPRACYLELPFVLRVSQSGTRRRPVIYANAAFRYAPSYHETGAERINTLEAH